jgi:photosystem II stability/assembly factor-like uncharacterized protein
MTFAVSHGGSTVYPTDRPSNEILVATIDGITYLNRSGPGASWEKSRRSLEGKHVSALLIEPKSGAIFAGTHDAGLYVSKDGGRNWDRKDRGIQSSEIFSLGSVESGGRTKVYAGTEPAHLYVSSDMGDTWEELPTLRSVPSVKDWTFPGEPHLAHVKHINFDPRSADTIIASIEVGGALKSTDAGKTWQEMHGFYEDVHRVMIPPKAPDRMYITGGDGVFFSADAGAKWEHLTDRTARISYPDGLVIHPDNPDLMYMSGAICSPGDWRKTHDADSRIARSTDGGRTWDYLEGGLPAHIVGNIEALSMNPYPGGYALAAGTTDGDVFYSDDEGRSWATIASNLPPVSKGGHYRPLQTAGAR